MKFSKWQNKFDVIQILQLSEKGLNIKQISKIIEIPEKRLGEMIKFHNLSINNKGRIHKINHSFFENIDNEIKAYLLGYTLADGSISIEPKKRNEKIYSYSKRISFCVSIDDYEVIEMIKNNISKTSNIKYFSNIKGAINRKRQLFFRINSSKLVDDLFLLNIKPRKTYDINFKFPFEKIPNNLINHFVRGFFDGDGSISESTFQFVNTSKIFMNQLIELFISYNKDITYRLYEIEGKTVKYYRLHFNTGKGMREELYKYLYSNSNFYLSRKKDKFNIDNTVLT